MTRAIGIVTAAGRGVRAGGPKALFRDAGGDPLACAHARALLAGGAELVLVVVRADVAPRLAALPEGARLVVSVALEAEGAAGSIRAAHASLAAASDAVAVVTPVDKRPAEPAVIRALLASMAEGRDAAKAVFAGRGGHPVAVRWELLGGLRSVATLRDLLATCHEVAEIEADATALDDLDDERAMSAAGLTPPRRSPAGRRSG